MSRYEYLLENVGFDYIIDEYKSRDFDEYITSHGGDVVRIRIYGDNPDNFMVTEK